MRVALRGLLRPSPPAARGYARFGRIAFAATLAVAVLVLPGCERNSPHGVARRYLESLRKANYAACYAMLADQDRKSRTLAEFLTEIPLAPDVGPALFHRVLEAMQFELGDVREENGKAFVSINVTAPNLPIWERTLDAAAGAEHFGGQNAEHSLGAGDFPTVTYADGVSLVKERRRWRVLADFTQRDRIVDQHREAIVEYHQFQYAKVIAGYQAMLADLERLNFTGAAGLAARYRAELAGVRAAQTDTSAAVTYAAKSLTLGDVAMSMSEERVPAIFGSVVNHGDRPLDAVEVIVNWYRGSGKDLKAAYVERHPIVMTPIEFTDFSVPVVPFVPGEKRAFGFILNAPVQVQQEASPYVTIGTINFTYLKAPLPKLAVAAESGTPVAADGPAPPPGVAVAKPSAPPAPGSSPQQTPQSTSEKAP